MIGTGLLLVGAALLLWSAALHLYLWADYFHRVHTIGPLFMAQGIAGVAIAIAIVAFRTPALALVGAFLLAATAGALLLSVWVGLFDYRERLAAPYVGMSLAVEIPGTVILVVAAAIIHQSRRPRP
jgi:hypothetical protein